MKSVLLLFTLLIANSAAAATALPDAELHRLSSYLAYITVGLDPDDPGGIEYVAGETCVNCQGSGKLGDGKVEFPCEWSDGLYYCNGGKIAKKSDGDAMDYEVDEAMCEAATCNCNCNCGCKGECGGTCGCDSCDCATPERDELMNKLDNPPARFNESFVRQLENDLQNALEEVQTLKAGKTCQPCAAEEQTEDQPEKIAIEEPSSKTVTLYRMKGSKWNWEGRSNPSTQFMRDHLRSDHGIDASMMNRESMQILHDNAHNYGEDKAFGFPTDFNSSVTASDCPSGTCPTSSRSSSGSSSCPSGNCPTSSSRSYSRGFGFFRR